MTAITICNAARTHRPTIETACRQIFQEHQARQPHAFPANSFDMLIKPKLDAAFRLDNGKIATESPNIFAAFIDDAFAGYIMVSHWAGRTKHPMPSVNIDDIHVQKQFRGQGVGEALLDHVKALSEGRDWGSLTATVWHGNHTSEALFDRAGFTSLNRSLRYGPDHQARDYPNVKKARTRGDISTFDIVFVTFCTFGLIAALYFF